MQNTQLKPKRPVALVVTRVLFTLFLAGTVVFIFSNSSQAGEASGLRSAALTAWLNALMARLQIGFTFTEGLVRKLAHLAEYALLGFWTMLTLRVYTRRILAFVAWPLLAGLLVAIADECYQLTVPGRAGLVTDVAIDFAGVALGLCAALFLQLLVGAILLSFKKAGRPDDGPPAGAVGRPSPARTAARVLLPCLSALVVAFIFINSTRTGAQSGVISQEITAAVGGAAPGANIPLERFVRKLGHVAEYALLGAALAATLRAYTRRLVAFSCWPLLGGTLVAVADECYQLTIEGRSGLVADVPINILGVCIGMGMVYAGAWLAAALGPRSRLAG